MPIDEFNFLEGFMLGCVLMAAVWLFCAVIKGMQKMPDL